MGNFFGLFPAFAAKYDSYTLLIVDGNLRTDDNSDKGSFK